MSLVALTASAGRIHKDMITTRIHKGVKDGEKVCYLCQQKEGFWPATSLVRRLRLSSAPLL